MPKEELEAGYQGLRLPWVAPDGEPYLIEGHWGLEDGRPVCIGLEIWKGVKPADDYKFQRLRANRELVGIGKTDLRTMPLVTIINALWQLQRDNHASLAASADQLTSENHPGAAPGTLERLAELLRETPEHLRSELPKRVSPDDRAHFQRVADVYRAALDAPGRKKPTDAVAKHFGVSYSTATKWVMRARSNDLKLLPKTKPGQPSATPKKGRKK